MSEMGRGRWRDSLSVLTNRAIPAEDLNLSEAESRLGEAQKMASNTPELMEIRDREVTQARAQIQVAKRN